MSRSHQMHGAVSFPQDVDPTRPLNYKYEAIIDYMILNPQKDKGEIAQDLGFTAPWLSTLTSSDAFIARYSFRREQWAGEMEGKVQAQIFEMAEKAAKRVIQELEKEDCDAQFALEASTRALRGLGFGSPKSQPAVHLTQTNVHVDRRNQVELREVLEGAQRRLEGVSRIIDGDLLPTES